MSTADYNIMESTAPRATKTNTLELMLHTSMNGLQEEESITSYSSSQKDTKISILLFFIVLHLLIVIQQKCNT